MNERYCSKCDAVSCHNQHDYLQQLFTQFKAEEEHNDAGPSWRFLFFHCRWHLCIRPAKQRTTV